jgi:hypothetical protein
MSAQEAPAREAPTREAPAQEASKPPLSPIFGTPSMKCPTNKKYEYNIVNNNENEYMESKINNYLK